MYSIIFAITLEYGRGLQSWSPEVLDELFSQVMLCFIDGNVLHQLPL